MEGISKVIVFNSSNALKVLSFLAASPEKDFISSEIQAVTKLARPGSLSGAERPGETASCP